VVECGELARSRGALLDECSLIYSSEVFVYIM
jgi:hypothetical protein